METLLTVQEAAEKLKVNEFALRKWIREGKIKAAKIGRFWRIKEDDLEEFVKERMNQ